MSSLPPNSAPNFPPPVPHQTESQKPKNRIGLTALALSVLGLLLGIFPATSALGWILLIAGLGTGIAGLFQKSKEKITSILAIALSLLGTVICAIVFLVAAVLSASHQSEASPSASDTPAVSETQVESPTPSPSASAQALLQPATPPSTSASTQPSAASSPSTTEAKDTVPRDYQSALAEARNYVKIMDFSYAGLYDQLTSEYGGKYSAEAAQYAMDNLDVDWNAEALGSAQNYVDVMPFSYAGLYDQLTSKYGEQFTPEQAQYAVDNVKVDWNAEALESARKYMDLMDMSTASLYDQLVSKHGEQFTPEQAQYAIDHL